MHGLLEPVRRVPSILDVIPLSDPLAESAAAVGRDGGDRARAVRDTLVEATRDTADAPTAIVAVHALGRLDGDGVVESLRTILEAGGFLAPHAAWTLADRAPVPALVEPLVGLVVAGRIGGMLAERTLVRWAGAGRTVPALVAAVVAARLGTIDEPSARARLVETLGLVGGDDALLVGLAGADEPPEVRRAAIAALGDRPGAGAAELERIAQGHDAVAATARLALDDHERQGRGRPGDGPTPGRLRVAQVHLGGHLDRALLHAGQGSTGGIATLLVQLGDALAADRQIAAVTTIGRGTPAEALAGLVAPPTLHGPLADEHAVLPAPLGRHEDGGFGGGWPAVIAAERGLRRVLDHRPADLLHLRMADVGSLAAARIARRRGLPTIFTLAPDPHAVIAEMERAGTLDRASFGPADAAGALWFRARLVRYLADTARQVVLFPRSELAARLRDLLAVDIAADPARYHVVPEGIDLAPVEAARREVAGLIALAPAPPEAAAPGGVLADLRAAVAALGPDRRGLPFVVSVGRLAEVKGMARLVEAFAADPALRARANLVVVGGDLDDPTPEERAEIDRIEAAFVPHPEMAEALVMLGHRPHDDVLRVLAAAEQGLGREAAPGGAYACGSRKEEFGLAIIEALAAGLPVVAPASGGPASYLEEGVTGRLVDTLDRAALAAGIHGALDLADRPGRAERARTLVAERFTIGAMADALVPVYAAAATDAAWPGRAAAVAAAGPGPDRVAGLPPAPSSPPIAPRPPVPS
jgi:glycosyltransferase involved in cell wall biosynthesis